MGTMTNIKKEIVFSITQCAKVVFCKLGYGSLVSSPKFFFVGELYKQSRYNYAFRELGPSVPAFLKSKGPL